MEHKTTPFWVANYKLGGGAFGNGYAQEEEMCWETPDLENAAAIAPHIYTRHPHAGVLQGNPTPVAIQGVNRVMSTPKSLSDNLETTHLDNLKNAVRQGDIKLFDRPETFNVLAIAAPDLHYGVVSPFDLANLKNGHLLDKNRFDAQEAGYSSVTFLNCSDPKLNLGLHFKSGLLRKFDGRPLRGHCTSRS